MKKLLLGCLGGGLLVVMGMCTVGGLVARVASTTAPAAAPAVRPGPPASTLAPKEVQKAEREKRDKENLRLVLENHSVDDSARAYIFKGMLKKVGQRCDDVESALMGNRGTWTVRCAPGYRYQFRFDSKGEVVGALRLP